jgi:mRNA interferase MazF
MVRGEIYFVDLAPRSGSEQAGRRPCIVVSHDAFASSEAWRSVTVVPLTSAARWRKANPTSVLFEEGECGLPKACAALAHQITTLDRDKFERRPAGRLTPEKQRAVDEALRRYLVL